MRVKSKFLSYLLTGAMVLNFIPAVGLAEAKAGTDKYEIMGTFPACNDWSTGVELTEVDDGIYSATMEAVPAGDYKYKIRKNENWKLTWQQDTKEFADGGADSQLSFTKVSDVTVTLIMASSGNVLSVVAEPVGGSSEDTPSTGSEDTPSTGSEDTPSTGSEDTPSTGGEDTPSTGGEDTPSTGSEGTPSTGSEGTPSTGSESTKTDTKGVWKIHFLNDIKWEKIGIWIWSAAGNAFSEWPGAEMKLETGTDKWYEYDYSGTAESISLIINDFKEKNALQTTDLKEVWSEEAGNVAITPGEYWIVLEASGDDPSKIEYMKDGDNYFAVISKDEKIAKESFGYDGQGLPAIDWNEEAVKISTEYMDKGSKETAVIDMGTETVVDKLVTGTIKGQDVNVEFKLANGLAWKVNGKDVTTTGDLNLGASLNTKNIPEDTVAALKKDNDFANTTTLTLDHNGDFGAKLQLLYPAGKDKAGKKFQLFYYNPTTKALEKQGDAVEADENGNVPFTFTHASDYVIAEEKTAAAPAATVAPGKKADVIVHVNFGANEAWSAINAYSWTKGGDVKFLGEWPGSAMSKNEKNAGWYSIAFDVNGADEVNIIFNDGNGTQTVDLKLSAATGEFWYTLGEKDADGKFAATESTTKPEGWVDSDVASSNGTGTTGTSSPKTGDNSKAPIAAAVMVLAIAGGVIAYRKREMFI